MDSPEFSPISNHELPALLASQDDPRIPRPIFSVLWGCFWANANQLRLWRSNSGEAKP
jgi:hypothetical protein